MAIAPNTTFVSGAILTAAQQNAFGFGIVGYATNASNVGLTTTVGDLGLSVTFTAIANRYYKYTFFNYANNGTTSTVLESYVTDASNNIINQLNMYIVGGANYNYQMLTYISTESAGSTTRKVRGKLGAGTGTAYGRLQFWVEDIGPA